MGVVKDTITKLFLCCRIVARKDCVCHSSCCCGDCETDITEHEPQVRASPHNVKRRKLPQSPAAKLKHSKENKVSK